MSETMSRRNFLRGSALFAGGVAAAGLAACAPTGPRDDEALPDTSAETALFEERPEPGEGAPLEFGAARQGADPIPPLDVPQSWDEEADIVVVGCGLGGCSAALYGAQQGASVIAIEKNSRTGGAARHASNLHVNTGGTKLQNAGGEAVDSVTSGVLGASDAAKGWTWPLEHFDPNNEEDVRAATAAYLEMYDYSPDAHLMRHIVQQGPLYGDWMCEQDEWEMYADSGMKFMPLRDKYMADHGYNEVAGFEHLMDAMTEAMENAGVIVEVDTACSGLVRDGEAIVGIQVTSGDQTRFIKANRGVILAAGGMGNNLDLLEKYIPIAYISAASGGPMTTHTGECIRMGLGVDADIAGFNSVSMWNGALDEYWQGEGDNFFSYMYRPLNMFSYLPFLGIDRYGHRTPVYKAGAQELYTGTPFNSGMGAHVAAYMSVGDRRTYMIWDADFMDHFHNEWAGTMFEFYDPEIFPYAGLPEYGKGYLPESFEADLDTALAMGALKKADTLEELAEMWNFDPEVFTGAVERWNADCDAGEDSELVVQMEPQWMTKIQNPPFYCACYGTQIGKTLCGLRVNENMQVVSTEHKVIPGLYAAWSTAGGFTGENDLSDFGACTPMGSVGMSGLSGWMAAKAILGEYDA